MSDASYTDDVYTVRKKFFSFIGQSFHVYDAHENLIFFCRQKGFKLKEDIRLYSDESKSQELLTLSARQVIDWGATYDIVDPNANETVGSLRRKAMKSMIRDEWLLFDPNGVEIGRTVDPTFLVVDAPEVDGTVVLTAEGDACPEIDLGSATGSTVATGSILPQDDDTTNADKLTVDYQLDPERTLDRRLGIAAAILMSAIEGRQG